MTAGSPSIFFLAAAIGFVAGLRSLTAPAAVSWATHLGWLNLLGSPLEFMASTAAVAIFSVLALAEIVADKLPRNPSRITRGPLLGRIVTGSLSGACLTVSAGQFMMAGMVLGGLGAVIGAYAGYHVRRRLTAGPGGVRDMAIAIPEDLVAIVLAYLIVSAAR